jgi:exopolysaccharide biosynthesis polyprenyl glycosylphosphotransferase
MWLTFMAITNKNEAFLLFAGDMFFFVLSLWLMLFVRTQEIPELTEFIAHLVPFSLVFILWVFVFFISGLYEKHTLILKSRIPSTIFNAQLVNSGIAVLFFYLFPAFGIAPKTNLFVYIIISFGLILFWRIRGISAIFERHDRERAILIGGGEEADELKEEVNNNPRYGLYFVSSIDLKSVTSDDLMSQSDLMKKIIDEKIKIVAADFGNQKLDPVLPNLYELMFLRVRFVDMHSIYEDIFDRIPMSLLRHSWFIENISGIPNKTNDLVKRTIDIVASVVIGLLSLILYPLIILLILLEDGRPIFFTQNRVGKNNKIFKTYKFRSMTVHNDPGGIAKNPQVTQVGDFLRKTRLDELPQIWNVLMGDVSLIGPRPEVPDLVRVYEKEIPYYNVRHLIKPGLSGWAQLYQRTPPKWAAALDATKLKLSYDLYYLKNRSLMLDIKIGLKTIKTLFSRNGV